MTDLQPRELSLAEIHAFMVRNGGKVTNHDLVKHFKRFLTNPATQVEARKQFKTFVNILSTIRNEDSEKLLVLRKKYHHKCPADTSTANASLSVSVNVTSPPGDDDTPPMVSSTPTTPVRPFGHERSALATSTPTSMVASPPIGVQMPLQPPPYKPPPPVQSPILAPNATAIPVEIETQDQYRECVDEFKWALNAFAARNESTQPEDLPVAELPPPQPDNKENDELAAAVASLPSGRRPMLEKQISVKEATKKFNQIASEEVAEAVKSVTSPGGKKAPANGEAAVRSAPAQPSDSKNIDDLAEITSHPKSKEWIVSAANGNYQELAKLASEHPELAKLRFPGTGYTALHFAAKHGNADIVKLIAGTHRANVNARTNGGYTPMHLAIQFGKDDIFDILFNVYKADRHITDYSGNKPMDYLRNEQTVSVSTYNKIKARKKPSAEKDLGFLRIGSINVRVKRTTEAFSNFLGVGSQQTRAVPPARPLSGQPHPKHHHQRQHRGHSAAIRSSAPPGAFAPDGSTVHKYWGSADSLPSKRMPGKLSAMGESSLMPPPQQQHSKHSKAKNHHRSKRSHALAVPADVAGFRSVPTTPNQNRAAGQLRHPQTGASSSGLEQSDSDSACGFDNNWKE